MAGAGFKTFNTGDVLTAADVNTYLMQQTVMVFADSAARTTALGANVSEGMLSYLKDTNQVEVYNGSSWVASDDPNAIQNTIVDAKGDLITATAADTPARLAVGSNGQFLAANSSTSTGLEWQTVTAGGMTLLESGTLSGASVTTGTLSGSYIDLIIYIQNWKPANDNAELNIRFNNDSTANRHVALTYSGNINAAFDRTSGQISTGNDNSVATNLIYIQIPKYANTATWKFATSNSITVNATTTTNLNVEPRFVGYNQIGAVTSLTFLNNSGNFTSGDYYVYGVK